MSNVWWCWNTTISFVLFLDLYHLLVWGPLAYSLTVHLLVGDWQFEYSVLMSPLLVERSIKYGLRCHTMNPLTWWLLQTPVGWNQVQMKDFLLRKGATSFLSWRPWNFNKNSASHPPFCLFLVFYRNIFRVTLICATNTVIVSGRRHSDFDMP